MTRTGRGSLTALAPGCSALIAGCAGSGGERGGHPDFVPALAGGRSGFEKRNSALHSHPLVVSVWASWSGPCRFEIPNLQRPSARYGRRVAFLDANGEGSPAAATIFLSENPAPNPSYSDPGQEMAGRIGAAFGFPKSGFHNRRGELHYLKPGRFAKQGELTADHCSYAQGGECKRSESS